MPLDWIDTTHLSFNSLLLMEREQIRWFPGWLPEPELSLALHANPWVEWYLRQKCPEVAPWLITNIPFPAGFADVTMGGHVFGDAPDAECDELERVTRKGGMVILCPGNNDVDSPAHDALIRRGYRCSRFEEPGDGWKRKYWKTV